MAAEKAMVLKLVETMTTSTTSGSSRYIFLISCLNTGSWSLGMPRSPVRFASRWTAMKMPRKYSAAGRMARTMMLE